MPSGSCSCGNVRYKYTGEPEKKTVCHCLDCRKETGSVFSTNLIVPAQGFELTAGTPKTTAKKAASGNIVTSFFCGDCGSTLWRETPAFATSKIVKAGLLDDYEALNSAQPELVLFEEHKPKWSNVASL